MIENYWNWKKKTSISSLLSNTALKQKVVDIKGKIPDISNLTTKAALNGIATEIEKKIPDNGKFITTPEFNNLTKLNFDDRMKEVAEKLGTKEKVNISINLGDQNNKKIERFQITDPNYFIGKSNFEDDSTQIYQVFQPAFTYFKATADNNSIFWDGNLKSCQKEKLNHLMYQIIVLLYL